MSDAPPVITIDFETKPIRQRPDYPPIPVGVSIKWPGARSRYYATGHPTENNASVEEAHAALSEAWASRIPKLFHHAKFDMAVATERLGLRELEAHEFHDTMFLAFLFEPHARSLGLKELAADLLDWPADEKDAVAEWVWAHRRYLLDTWGAKVTSRAKAGEWICYAPGRLVGDYACGDTDRTEGLFNYLYPRIVREGMLAAYRRELRIQSIFAENERRGLRVDMPALERDIGVYSAELEKAESWLRKELRAGGLNFDADRDVASVLLDRGIVHPDDFSRTATGQLSMKKDVLTPDMFSDPNIASALGYRNRMVTCVHTFMEAWHSQGMRAKGRIHANWSQVRNPGGGTRTGRPSCSEPNLLNLSKDFDGRPDGYKHPDFLEVRHLPLVRKYVLPEEGHVWLHRDFSGQELRVFAHFEEGELFDAYLEDPAMDPHALVGRNIVEVTGRTDLDRTGVKVLNFQAIYGGGIPAAQAKLRCTRNEAKAFKDAHDKALPGRKVLSEELTAITKHGDPIRTWGGRLYYVEPSRIINGRKQTYFYKLINYLVQGSAADLTKQVMADWADETDGGAPFLCQVYDELNISAPEDEADRYMDELREVMQRDRLDVPMLSDGKRGPNWGTLTKCL